MRKLLLTNHQSPGDIVMLTCALRDLHLTYPNEYYTDINTSCGEIWENNPYITKFDPTAPDVTTIKMHYPAIHGCNDKPYHFCQAFTSYLSEQLKRPITHHCINGDIYLSDDERNRNIIGKPYWLCISGGKSDYTTKHWCPDRMQEVVDHFAGVIDFVQVGQSGQQGSLKHINPKLKNVIDLVDQTTIRDWIHLVAHADGVVCGLTGMMHLAAAVPTSEGAPKNRAAVIIAGGREPLQWFAYPHHQTLHTMGALPCCDNGGCWKSRIVKLNDGDKKDQSLCVMPVIQESGRVLPRCMDMITSCDVINAIQRFLAHEKRQTLGPALSAC